MNPWYENLLASQSISHDKMCESGPSCRTRDNHIKSAYMVTALRRMVEDLRRQLHEAKSEGETK